jgi:hypothetical protein
MHAKWGRELCVPIHVRCEFIENHLYDYIYHLFAFPC